MLCRILPARVCLAGAGSAKLCAGPAGDSRRIKARPRLIERLNEELQRKLILLSAHGGFGKSTLAAQATILHSNGNSCGAGDVAASSGRADIMITSLRVLLLVKERLSRKKLPMEALMPCINLARASFQRAFFGMQQRGD
jgi:hypothetical protein